MKDAYESCERKLGEMRSQLDGQVEDVKERQKISYRDQIVELETRIIALGMELDEANARASPQREENLAEEKKDIKKQRQDMSAEINRLTEVLKKRDRGILDLKIEAENNSEEHVQALKELNNQLKLYESRLHEKDMEREVQLGDLERQMGKKRQNQADDLKQELRRHEDAFERERFEWKHIIEQFQTENGKIKKDWNDDKEKYKAEKKRLGEKINELRERLREKEEILANNDNAQMLKELQEMDMEGQNFATYQSGITFMDRQVRKSAIKIQ